MGFYNRYWKPVINLKEKLLRGLKVYSAEIIFTSNYSNWNPVSFISDPLNDLGPHVFDAIRFTFEREIFSIAARSLNENNLEVKMKLIGDIVIHSFIAHSNRTVKSIKVTSEAGKYFIALGSERIHPEFGNKGRLLDLGDNIKRKLLRRPSPIKKSYEVQLDNFFNFVKSKKPADPGIKDGIKAILAVEAALKSINEKGKEIFLDETN